MSELATFDRHVRQWGLAACEEWGYPPPPLEWYEQIHARLPPGLRTTLGAGLDSGTVRTEGRQGFTLSRVGTGTDPHVWFDPNALLQQPDPRWETFVQVAEYVSIHADQPNCEVVYDDRSMPISVSRHGELLWHVEVGERFAALPGLAATVAALGAPGAGASEPAGETDESALRVARSVAELRPLFLSFVGIGGRLDHSLLYHDQEHFELVPDLVVL